MVAKRVPTFTCQEIAGQSAKISQFSEPPACRRRQWRCRPSREAGLPLRHSVIVLIVISRRDAMHDAQFLKIREALANRVGTGGVNVLDRRLRHYD